MTIFKPCVEAIASKARDSKLIFIKITLIFLKNLRYNFDTVVLVDADIDEDEI